MFLIPLSRPARHSLSLLISSGLMALAVTPAFAQDGTPAAQDAAAAAEQSPATIDRISDEDGSARAKRTRIYLGPKLAPAYPGADRMSIGPYFDFSRAREGEFFAFEAPDESAGFNFYEKGGSALGLTVNMLGKRRSRDVDGLLPSVKRSFEFGVAGQSWITPDIRVRLEGRKAITGHKGWVGTVSADYVAQRGDDWLFSVGPRITLGDGKFHRTYYGVTPQDALISGLTAERPKGGVHSVGLAASYLHQFNPNWGVATFVRYEHLLGDAADSPVTKAFGSRHQPSAGVAISYTFGARR